MDLKNILFYNFRNFKNASIDINPGLNLIYGENGVGKTSFLEGLHLILTGGLFKDNYDALIRHGEELGGVSANFTEGVRELEKIVYLRRDGIIREANKKRVTRMRSFKTHNTVVFEPYDTFLIDGSPSLRRKFLDDLISDVSLSYEKNLRDYNNLLKMRNNYLKFYTNPKRFLDALDEDYIRLIKEIDLERNRYLDLIKKRTKRHIYDIEPDWSVDFSIDYSYDKADLHKFRDEHLIDDINRKHSSWGAHKDDLIINFNDELAKITASRGQKRAIVVSMKLANLDILKRLSNKESIILLDDLLYEFDEIRNSNLVNKIQGLTAFVTSTKLISADSVIEIKNNEMKYI